MARALSQVEGPVQLLRRPMLGSFRVAGGARPSRLSRHKAGPRLAYSFLIRSLIHAKNSPLSSGRIFAMRRRVLRRAHRLPTFVGGLGARPGAQGGRRFDGLRARRQFQGLGRSTRPGGSRGGEASWNKVEDIDVSALGRMVCGAGGPCKCSNRDRSRHQRIAAPDQLLSVGSILGRALSGHLPPHRSAMLGLARPPFDWAICFRGCCPGTGHGGSGGDRSSLLLLLWLLLISMALGAMALDLIAPSSQGTGLERSIFAASIGFGAISLLIFGLGTAQLLYRLVVLGCLIALTAFVPGWARSWAGSLRTGFAGARARWETADLRLYSIGISTLALCGLAGYIWAIAPSIHYDALVYHLGVPAIYVQQHGLVKVAEQFSSYWAHNAEMLYTLGLLLVGQPLPALCHLLFGVLTAGLVFCMGRRLGGARLGLVGAVLFYSLPLVTWESGTAYIDLQVAFYSFATAYALMIWWQDGGEGWLIGAGLLAGLGLGTKLDAVLAVLPLILLLLAGLILRHGVSRRVLSGLLRFGVPALLLSAIWLLRDWVWTGKSHLSVPQHCFREPPMAAGKPGLQHEYVWGRPRGPASSCAFRGT